MKKLSVWMFYLSLLCSIAILIAFLMDVLLLIETIKYSLVTFSVTLFFLVVMLELKTGNKLSKISSIFPCFVGFILWNLSLFELLKFNEIWNIAFLLMLFGLISSLFFICTKKSSQIMKSLTAFSALMLISVIYITGNSVFDNFIVLYSSLSLFSLFSLISLFFPDKLNTLK